MKHLLALLAFTMLPLAALAQTGPNVPVIIVEQGNQLTTQPDPAIARPVPGGGFANFPDIAVTRIGENTTGQHVDAPPAASAPPAAPAAAPNAPAPATPAAPASPTPPVAKLWPRDTVSIFMPSCVGFYAQFAQPCMCVITKLMATMPHDEFLRESNAGTIESDPRVTTIRTDCASAPKQKQ